MSDSDPNAAPTQPSPPPAVGDGPEPSHAGKLQPEELRLRRPPSDIEVDRPAVYRLRSEEGSGRLNVLPDAAPTEEFQYPDGWRGAAERALAKGASAEARQLASPFLAATDERGNEDDECSARAIIARAHLMDGDVAAAREALGDERLHARCATADAALCLSEGKIADARRRLQDALSQNPQGIAERYMTSLVLVAEGRLADAVDALARVAASDAGHAVARHQLGQLILNQGDPARAGTLFEMALESAPEFVAPGLALAEMLMNSRQYGEALNLLSRLTEQAPNALSAHTLKMRLLLEAGEVQTALQIGEALRKAAPDHAEVCSLWAEAMAQLGRGDEACQVLEDALVAAGSEDKARLLRVLSHIALNASPSRLMEAVTRLREAITFTGQKGEMRLELVELHLHMQDTARAREVFEQFLQDPDVDVGALLQGAMLARNYGLWGQARRCGMAALRFVRGSGAESQIEAFLAALPEEEGDEDSP